MRTGYDLIVMRLLRRAAVLGGLAYAAKWVYENFVRVPSARSGRCPRIRDDVALPPPGEPPAELPEDRRPIRFRSVSAEPDFLNREFPKNRSFARKSSVRLSACGIPGGSSVRRRYESSTRCEPVGARSLSTRPWRRPFDLDAPVPPTTAGLVRVADARQSLMCKTLRLGELARNGSRWAGSAAADDPFYWRREALVYAHGLPGRLAGRLRGPHCHGVFDRPDGSVAIWLEDLATTTPGTSLAIRSLRRSCVRPRCRAGQRGRTRRPVRAVVVERLAAFVRRAEQRRYRAARRRVGVEGPCARPRRTSRPTCSDAIRSLVEHPRMVPDARRAIAAHDVPARPASEQPVRRRSRHRPDRLGVRGHRRGRRGHRESRARCVVGLSPAAECRTRARAPAARGLPRRFEHRRPADLDRGRRTRPDRVGVREVPLDPSRRCCARWSTAARR